MVKLCCDKRAEDAREDVRLEANHDRNDFGDTAPLADGSEGEVGK